MNGQFEWHASQPVGLRVARAFDEQTPSELISRSLVNFLSFASRFPFRLLALWAARVVPRARSDTHKEDEDDVDCLAGVC